MKTDMCLQQRLSRTAAIVIVAGSTLALTPAAAYAGPQGGRTVRGQVRIDQSGLNTTITAGDRSIIEWASFNIRANESVRFIQPSVSARVLNRIISAEPTSIDGRLTANGRVYIVNPAGVVFGPNSIVNAAAVIAAAGAISDENFLRGADEHFTSLTGEVINHGTITTEAVFGAVHLLGRRVENHGSIVSDRGIISLVAGGDVILRETGDAGLFVVVDGRAVDPALGPAAGAGFANGAAAYVDAGVLNTGTVSAPSGASRAAVTLAAGDMYSLAIRNAGTVSSSGGAVVLSAGSGQVRNEGVISASVGAGRAGAVSIQGPEVIVTGEVRADADAGEAGRIEITSQYGSWLAGESVVSAAGGSGSADGGDVSVDSLAGDTVFDVGALIDVSGGALGGDGGAVSLGADGTLYLTGDIDLSAGPGGVEGELVIEAGDVTDEPADSSDAKREEDDDEDEDDDDGDDDGDEDDDDGDDDDGDEDDDDGDDDGDDDDGDDDGDGDGDDDGDGDGGGDDDGGPGGPSLAADLAGAEPRELPLDDPATPQAYDVEVLRRLAILARPISDGEAAQSRRGRAVYSDMPESRAADASQRTSVATRIDMDAARAALEAYNGVFGMPGEDRTEQVSESLASVFDRYLGDTAAGQPWEVDPVAFRTWLAAQEDAADADGADPGRAAILGLDTLLERLRGLGLTTREYREAEARILRPIAPSGGLDVETLSAILQADPAPADLPAATEQPETGATG